MAVTLELLFGSIEPIAKSDGTLSDQINNVRAIFFPSPPHSFNPKFNFQSLTLANPALSSCSIMRVSLRTQSDDIPDNFVQNPRRTTYQKRPRLWLSQNRCPRTGVRARDSWWTSQQIRSGCGVERLG